MRDKPTIDRADELRRERVLGRLEHCLERAYDLIGDDESLGEPYREGDRLVFPIVSEEAGRLDNCDLRALLAALVQ